MKRLIFFVLLLIAISTQAAENANLALHIIEYINKDYPLAVSDGKVLNESEYNEQVDFAKTLIENIKNLGGNQNTINKIILLAKDLRNEIESKSESKWVVALCTRLKTEIIKNYAVKVAPSAWPSLSQGKKVFAKYCIDCHGDDGNGLGILAKGMTPPPTDFTNLKIMKSSSPFSVFNSIKLGVQNTAMRPFSELSDEDIWSVAFYISTLRHEKPSAKAETGLNFNEISLEDVASLSDSEIVTKFFAKNSDREILVSALRHLSVDGNPILLLNSIGARLKEVVSLKEQNNTTQARAAAASIYLDMVEPLEPRIRATSPELVNQIEMDMAVVREALGNNDPQALGVAIKNLELSISKISSILGKSHLTPTMSFISAAAILLREGFEAVLIILALIGVLRGIGSRNGLLWVHAGWMSAVGLGFGLWFLSGKMIEFSGAQRESLEAIVSLIAVVVLLYMGFWLHSRTEINRWKQFLGGEMKRLLESKSFVGLFSISFIAVFREAFESVLFIRAIWIESESHGQWAIAGGVVTSFLLVLILAWALLHFSEKVPLRLLFTITSSTIAVLAVVLAGKGIHALQESALIRVTTPPFNLRLDLIGIYPSWECLISQLGIGILSIILWKLGSRPLKN